MKVIGIDGIGVIDHRSAGCCNRNACRLLSGRMVLWKSMSIPVPVLTPVEPAVGEVDTIFDAGQETCTGIVLLVYKLFPSWPYPFHPHAQADPSDFRA